MKGRVNRVLVSGVLGSDPSSAPFILLRLYWALVSLTANERFI